MRRILPIIVIASVLIVMLAACGGSISNRTASGSSAQPGVSSPAQTSNGASTGDEIDRALTQLENDLNSVDTLDDLQ
jgi:uncharacterized lipoprotein YehR (DUF1307 family)